MPTLNELHERYAADPSADNLNEVIGSARSQALRQARIQSSSEAEDIAQDAALIAFDTLHLYNPKKASFSTWIWKITDSVMKDRARKQKRRPPLAAPDPAPEHSFIPIPEDALVRLLIEGHSLADCQRILGVTRKKLRYHLRYRLRKAGELGPNKPTHDV